MTLAEDFSAETTLHGPKHAYAASKRYEQIFWATIFTIGMGIATWQCAALITTYVHDGSNTVTVEHELAPDLLADVHYFKVCPKYWLDRQRVNDAVRAGKFSYKNLLFALSLIPSVSDIVLIDMNSWGEIHDSQRIWRLERCQSGLASIMARKKRKAAALNLFRRKKRGLIGDVVDGVGDVVDDVVDGTADVVDSVIPDSGDLISGTFDAAQGVVEKGTEAFETLSETAKNVGAALIALDWSAALDRIAALYNEVCDANCGPHLVIADWKQESSGFHNMVNGTYATLTDFFAPIATDFNALVRGIGGEFVKWEITKGGMCQVVEVKSEDLVKNGGVSAQIPLSESVETLFGGGGFPSVSKADAEILPYSTESTYDPASDDEQEPGLSTPPPPGMISFLNPFKVVDTIIKGMMTSVRINILYMKKITRERSCKDKGNLLRVPKNYAALECKNRCRKKFEKVDGNIAQEYEVITENSMGDIPIKKKLAPSRFVETDLDRQAAADCMHEQECSTQHYCEEWDIAVTTKTGRERPDLKVGQCDGMLDQMLAAVKMRVSVGKGYQVSHRRRLSALDMLGIIGGILGLYVGCSVTSIIHCCVFWMKKGLTSC